MLTKIPLRYSQACLHAGIIFLITVLSSTSTAFAQGPNYSVAVDICHDNIGDESTGGKVLFEFFAGDELMGQMSKTIGECPGQSGAWASSHSYKPITSVKITNNSSDAFYIDAMTFSKAGIVHAKHGANNVQGWCFSTDPEDAHGEWEGYVVSPGCQPFHSFDFPSHPLDKMEYKVDIDACHSDLENEGTNNKITMKFYAGSNLVETVSKNGINQNCNWSDARFSIETNQDLTHITVETNGDDGFYIDEIRLYKKYSLAKHYGRDDKSGWCLSTDPADAHGSWKNNVSSSGCQRIFRFDY